MMVERLDLDKVTVLRVAGELEAGAVPAFRETLADRVAGRSPLTVVSLADLRYVDSAGLGALLSSLRAHAERGGQMVLAAIRPEIRHVLHITRLLPFFSIHPTERDAVTALLANGGGRPECVAPGQGRGGRVPAKA